MEQGFGAPPAYIEGRNFGDTILLYVQEWGPRILAALAILLVAWLLARGAKWGVAALIDKTPLAKRAHAHQGVTHSPGKRNRETIGAQLGGAVYWLVLLVGLMLAVQPLGLAAATSPLGNMLNGFGAAIPNILGAVLILFIGSIVASVAKKAVEALLTAVQPGSWLARVGVGQGADPTLIPRIAGGVVFALIIIPVAIAALEQLNIRSISEPATAMLRIVLDAIPLVIAAGIILAIAVAVGRFAGKLLTQFLQGTGFDSTVAELGIGAAQQSDMLSSGDVASATSTATKSPDWRPSVLAGNAVTIAIVLFGLMEAFRQLNFAYGSQMIAEILALLGSVIFGSVIIVVAVIVARFVSGAVERSGGGRLGATVVRVAIIVLGAAIGLKFMGLADDIINLAFGLILGAIAVAAALAFGLGGRQAAARLVERAADKAEAQANAPKPQPQPMVNPNPTPTQL